MKRKSSPIQRNRLSRNPVRDIAHRGTARHVSCRTESIVLPSDRVPYVVQRLTPSQLDIIPRQHYSVKVLGPEHSVRTREALHQILRNIPSSKLGIVVKGPTALSDVWENRKTIQTQGVRLLSDVSLATPLPFSMTNRRVNSPHARHEFLTRTQKARLAYAKQHVQNLKLPKTPGSTETLTREGLITFISQWKENYPKMSALNKEIQAIEHRLENPPPDKNIFREPVDENKLAVCILDVYNTCFHENDTCFIESLKCNVTDFCMLMHIAFDQMKLLKNKALKPFCEYLQEKVFAGEKKLTVRTFNNYSRQHSYENLRDLLIQKNAYSFRSDSPPPQTTNIYVLACHRLARIFQNKPYFKELKTMMENLQGMEL